MSGGKTAMTCTLDDDVHAWIKNKVGKNSTFVNNILLKAMIKELDRRKEPARMCKTCFTLIRGPPGSECVYCSFDMGE